MKRIQASQSGLVSIVVCLVIMVILSIVTIGFSQLMARAQRQAVDRQLSTQAFYAAETGVNDALLALAKDPNYTKANCNPITLPPPAPVTIGKDIGTSGVVQSTCVTVKPVVPELVYKPITVNQFSPKIITLDAAGGGGGSGVPTVSITWSQADGSCTGSKFRASAGALTPVSAWNVCTGMLKIVILPYVENSTRRADLRDDMGMLYAYPQDGSGTNSVLYSDVTGDNFGALVNTSCAGSSCTLAITGLDVNKKLKLAMSSVYVNNNVIIKAFNGVTQLELEGAQALIDSTGRNGDILRRIQVRASLQPPYIGNLNNALISDAEICKLITANPDNTVSTKNNSPCLLTPNI